MESIKNNGVREQIVRGDVGILGDHDLLAVLVGAQAAKILMAENGGNLRRLAGRRVSEIRRLPGVGTATATAAVAAMELGRRVASPRASTTIVSTAADAAEQCQDIATDPNENFVAIGVNSRNRVTGRWTIATGWETGVNLTALQVFTVMVKEGVSRVVFVHNHPSGDPTPSAEDVRFTRMLLDAAKTLDILILDHVIVGTDGFESIRNRSDINFD